MIAFFILFMTVICNKQLTYIFFLKIIHFIGIIEYQFSVTFDNVEVSMATTDEKGNLILKEQLITIRVEVEELPIYVKNKIVDMSCTLFDRTYRKKIEIFNRSSTVCKVEIKIPKIFSQFVDINPMMMYVQAKGSHIINIKITPTLLMLKKLIYYSSLKEDFINSAMFSLPIEMKVRAMISTRTADSTFFYLTK